MEAIAQTFKLLWCTQKGFEVRDMGNHRVLFESKDPLDVDKDLKGEPWSFDKKSVALRRASKHMDVRSLVFDRTGFWVQLHNLPIGSFSMAVAQEVVSVVGTINESETNVAKVRVATFLELESLLI